MYLLKSRSIARTIPCKDGYDMKSEATTRPVVVNPNLIQGLPFFTRAAGK